MLSRRNLAMMLTMCGIILVLFLSTVVLKEYFNDYDVNHAAQEERISREESEDALGNGNPLDAEQHVIYVGAQEAGFHEPIQEWAGYRKMSYEEASDVQTGIQLSGAYEKADIYLLLSGDVLESDTQQAAEALLNYVQDGGIVIFCSLPSYQTMESCEDLRYLLGIQTLRGESVRLAEIRLYQGFLLGGEVCYTFEEDQDPERIDMAQEIPWYDISSRTKSYMVGFIAEAEKEAMGLHNEDMPAIIWRSNAGSGSVFAVNGDYMEGEAALGLLDAMVYETRDYALYGVVNAQNLSVAGFPDLTIENETKFAEVYGFHSQQFCRDILWPSLAAAAHKGDWKITAYFSAKQSNVSAAEPDMDELIEYLKYFNEESAEVGIALGRIKDTDIRLSLTEEKEKLDSLNLTYAFTGAYLRSENGNQLSQLLLPDGYMDLFPDVRTVVREYDPEQEIFSWLTDQITMQSATVDGYQHTYYDNFRLKSLQTALGYSNVQADIYRVIWLEDSKDAWEQVSEKFASNLDTYWKPFAAFEKTTITESDRRLRIFLNETVTSAARDTAEGKEITIQVENFYNDAWVMLRTHGEELKSMEGGTWDMIEADSYLLHLTADTATVFLQSDQGTYYYEDA